MSVRVGTLAVENLDLLHALGDGEVGGTTALARALSKDPSNVSKTVGRLREAGLLDQERLSLSEDGAAVTRLLGPAGEVLAPGDLIALRHDQIELDPDNEREIIDQDELGVLRESILLRGLLQAPVVTAPADTGGRYRLMIGERRWLAIENAIIQGDWPADRLITCRLAAPLSPRDRALARMSENLQRADLHPLDEGRGFVALRDVHGLPTAEIADEIGRSQKHVQDRIALVEKTAPEDQARMRLPKDDPNHLNYRDARELMREHRPKPAVDVTAKEALTLVEVMARHAVQPSRHPGMPGADGWIEIPAAPAGGAAASLHQKGYLDIVDAEFGPGAFVRVARTGDIAQWIANRTVTGLKTALYHARVEVLTAWDAAELEKRELYATDWLNPKAEPFREPESVEPPPAEVPAAKIAAAPPVREIFAGMVAAAGNVSSEPVTEPTNPVRMTDSVPTLTSGLQKAMAEVCRAIEDHPEAGPQNAYIGARAYDYYNDKTGSCSGLLAARLIKIQPDAKRKGGYLVCLSTLGEVWRDAFAEEIANVEAFTTPWLNEPEADTDTPPAEATKPTGPLAPMLKDQFADQLREVGDDEDGDVAEDLSVTAQVAWVDAMAEVINPVHRPMLAAIKASLEALRDA